MCLVAIILDSVGPEEGEELLFFKSRLKNGEIFS